MHKQHLCSIRLQCSIHLKWLKSFTYEAEVKWKAATKASSAKLLMSSKVTERLHLQSEHSSKRCVQP